MGRKAFFDRKADRFQFARFTCVQCGCRQSVTVAVSAKTVRCIECGGVHKVAPAELSSNPKY